MTQELALTAELASLLASHGAAIQALLPEHFPPLSADVPSQAWGNDFVVYELGQLPDGRWAKLHHFLRPDMGCPHDHFCDIESHGIKGSYIERVYKNGSTYDVERPAGGQHTIPAETMHRLVALPQGPAWTLCFTGPIIREGRHYPELYEALC